MAHADLRAFLENFRPDGIVCYVAIVPDGATAAASFNGTDREAAARWIERTNEAAGLYFTVNSTGKLSRKPAKTDITGIAAVWADIDPLDGAGRPYDQERQRLTDLAAEVGALDIPPTVTIDSGNGLQPIWCLDEPIEASAEYRNAAEQLCIRIEAALGAKGTFNVDRLLRLPGTTNYPNKRKRKLGRGEAQARILAATWRRYTWRELLALADQLEQHPPRNAVPTEPERAPGGDGGQHDRLTDQELDALRKSLAGEKPDGWHNAMVRMVGRLVADGAADWFILDWAMSYRWQGYSEVETRRDVRKMIEGARAKGFARPRPGPVEGPATADSLSPCGVDWMFHPYIPAGQSCSQRRTRSAKATTGSCTASTTSRPRAGTCSTCLITSERTRAANTSSWPGKSPKPTATPRRSSIGGNRPERAPRSKGPVIGWSST
jgi:hypothetical protein